MTWAGGESCSARGRGYSCFLFAHASGDRLFELIELFRISAAAPFRQIDGLELAKTERRLGAVKRGRDKPTAVPCRRRLVADPGRLYRCAAPQHDDGVSGFERSFDRVGILVAA